MRAGKRFGRPVWRAKRAGKRFGRPVLMSKGPRSIARMRAQKAAWRAKRAVKKVRMKNIGRWGHGVKKIKTQPTWKEKRDAREAAARAKRAAEKARWRAERKRKEEEAKKKQPGKVGKAAGAVIAAANKLYWDKKKWGF